jgi:hypothetical protein
MEDKKKQIEIYDLKDREGENLWVVFDKNKITVKYWVKPYTTSKDVVCETSKGVWFREHY